MAEANIAYKFDGENDAPVTVIMANGARMPMDGPFMNRCAARFAESGLRFMRFEFPFQVAERRGEGQKPVNTHQVLKASYHSAIRYADNGNPIIAGGRSLGAAAAAAVTEEARSLGMPVIGLLCLGYPFHQLDDPGRDRLQYLTPVTVPTCILQGTEDRMAIMKEVKKYKLPKNIEIDWLKGVTHLFSMPDSPKDKYNEIWDVAIDKSIAFAKQLISQTEVA